MFFLLFSTACLSPLDTARGGLLGGDPLSIDRVTSIPAGDAVGEEWEGQYQTEIRTTSCEGQCGPIQDGFFTVSFCDVGDTDTEYLEIDQDDGLLQVDLNDPISYYQGGVDQDGTLRIGGHGTEYGGSVDLTAVIEGRFEGDELLGTASARMWGSVDLGDDEPVVIDCEGTYLVEGFWRVELQE